MRWGGVGRRILMSSVVPQVCNPSSLGQRQEQWNAHNVLFLVVHFWKSYQAA